MDSRGAKIANVKLENQQINVTVKSSYKEKGKLCSHKLLKNRYICNDSQVKKLLFNGMRPFWVKSKSKPCMYEV